MATENTKRHLEYSKLVIIEWVDAVADVGWDTEVKPDIHSVITAGFIVAETKEAICIASTVSKDNSNARMHIPKAWIKTRKVIKLENTKRKSKGKKLAEVGGSGTTEALPAVDGQGLTQLSDG